MVKNKYSLYIQLLVLIPAILVTTKICITGTGLNTAAAERGEMKVSAATESMETVIRNREYCRKYAADVRVINCEVLERTPVLQLNKKDLETLQRIVEAEAGGEDENGKLLVANVVLNRVENEAFPDTVSEVVYQKSNGIYQFSPVKDGRINHVNISKETVEAVERALNGEDISQGALYFMARCAVSEEKVTWFDNKLTWLFAYGGHEFFE